MNSKIDDISNALKFLFFFRKIRNCLKNGLNIDIITDSIIRNKISQIFFNIICLNKTNHLLCTHPFGMRTSYLVKTNENDLKLTIIINVICYYTNKSNRII